MWADIPKKGVAVAQFEQKGATEQHLAVLS
jgi:hypothetical protein